MKKLFVLFSLIFLAAITAPSIFAEQIERFDATVAINTDGTMSVVEKILYDFGNVDRHGIFRNIPTVKTNTDGKRFRLDYTKLSVTDESGKLYRYTKTNEDDLMNIKIGDPNRTITGLHEYNISYTVSGALAYFSDHDELYWNVTGTEWNVHIATVNVAVTLPKSFDQKDLRFTCYTGVSGSSQQDCTSTYNQNSVRFTTKDLLSTNEGLTIVLGFPKNAVAVLEPKPVINFWDTPLGQIVKVIIIILAIIAFLLWYIIYPVWLIYKWFHFGRDPKPTIGVTSAWFDAPKTKSLRRLTPGETGTLVDEVVDMRDLSATIVDLARRGYLKIIEKKKNEFTLQKEKDALDPELLPFERKLLDGIFSDGVDTRNLKGANLYEAVEEVKKLLYDDLVDQDFFPKDPQKIRNFYSIISGLAMTTVNFPLAFIAGTFGRHMPRKTLYGADQTNVARSLKNFLASQEEKLSYQAKNQIFFEKFLPFAVAFGVEKIWAQRFADIAMKPPEWYKGTGGGSFNSTYFVSSLQSSFSGFTTAATPTRSSSGFSSGFSGGSSGGGGGGGGGGSW